MSQATYVQHGEAIDYTPSSDVAAGEVVVQGRRCGVAKHAHRGQHARRLAVGGIFDVVKATGAINVGAALYWDADGNPQAARPAPGATTTCDRQHLHRLRGGRGGRDRHDGPGRCWSACLRSPTRSTTP